MTEPKIPDTLEEAFEILSTIDNLEEWKNQPEREATALAHHSIGMWIRNNWGLWERKGKLYETFVNHGLDHPDDMSGVILTSFHRHLNGKDLDIEGQIDNYDKYWLDVYSSKNEGAK